MILASGEREAAVDGGERSDEALMAELGGGRQEALQVLHRRYAPLVFHLACRSIDRPAAEEITQDVFLQVWRKAASFDPARGGFRSWMLQIAHHRILNELRRRGRRPRIAGRPEDAALDQAAQDPGPEELAWNAYRTSTIHRALAALPREQGRALRLAFFQDLTHEQVAEFLDVPLGTAKGRIRGALARLSPRLAALVAVLVAVSSLSLFQWNRQRLARGREQRALTMLTSSRMEALRLLPPAPTGPVEAGPHANYRAERGGGIAVFTLSHVPEPPPGEVFRLWRRSGGAWTALGALRPDTQGYGRLLVEEKGLPWPEALMLTRERADAPASAPAEPFLRWEAGK